MDDDECGYNLGEGYDGEDDAIGDGIDWSFKLVPTNSQKLKGFTWGMYKFTDSLQFMSGSLQSNVEMYRDSLSKKCERLPILSQSTLCQKNGSFSETRYNLLTGKLSFPYSCLLNTEHAKTVKCLPPIGSFDNDLNNEACDPDAYKNSKAIWDEFNCQNLLEFTRLV